jgi:hypothetical protein
MRMSDTYKKPTDETVQTLATNVVQAWNLSDLIEFATEKVAEEYADEPERVFEDWEAYCDGEPEFVMAPTRPVASVASESAD